MGGSTDVKETEYEKELAKVYAEEWQLYQDEMVPFENIVIQDAQDANDKAVYDDIAENTNLGYKKSFTEAKNNTLASMQANGVNPNSGKFKQTLGDISNNEASVTSDATARSQVAGQERYIGQMSNVMAMGQGQSQEATATLSDIAQSSQRKAFNDASISQQQSDNWAGLAGATLGAAGSYYKNKPDIDINDANTITYNATNNTNLNYDNAWETGQSPATRNV